MDQCPPKLPRLNLKISTFVTPTQRLSTGEHAKDLFGGAAPGKEGTVNRCLVAGLLGRLAAEEQRVGHGTRQLSLKRDTA